MENNNPITDITDETEEEKKQRELKEKREKYIEQLKERDLLIKKELINLVMRQTTYSEDEAKEQLEKNKWNFHLVLKQFMTPNPIKEGNNNNNKSINIQQTIYKEIRTMMDSASKKQRYQAEYKRRMEEQNNEIKKENEEQKKEKDEQYV
tara:strand:- start:989 stop:1438 length:450 start_codon:yes stop_codon:yes gene_type:complete